MPFEARSTVSVAPFLQAWMNALHEWDWQSAATLERNLAAFHVRSNVDWRHSTVPPTRLVGQWLEEGRPEPRAWIEERLATSLHRPHPIASSF
jgi:hypothetical protein